MNEQQHPQPSPMASRIDRGIFALLMMFALGAFLWLCWSFRYYTVDDAFITLRQARNLVEGYGFVYNPEGPRVESYTNHLLYLFQALFLGLGMEGLPPTKILGALAGAGTLLIVALLARDLAGWLLGRRAPLVSGLAAALFLVPSPLLVSGSMSGLETSLFGFLVTGGAWCFARLLMEPEDRRWAICGGLALGFACWTRPEGIALALGFSGVALVAAWRGRRGLREALLAAGIALGLWAILTAWRLIIFGYPFPNTYYAKMSQPLSKRFPNGVGYVGDWAFLNGGLVVMLLAAGALFLGRERRGLLAHATLLLSVIGFLGIVMVEGGDWIPHLRLIAPIHPVAVALAGAGVTVLVLRILKHPGPQIGVLAAAGLMLGLGAHWPLHGETRRAVGEIQTRVYGWADAHQPMGKWLGEWQRLREAAGQDRLRVAIEDIGLVGWHSRAEIIDLAGLADPIWAHMHYNARGTELYPAGDLIHIRLPHVIVIMSFQGHRTRPLDVRWTTNQAIYTHPDFHSYYTEYTMFTHKDFPGDGYFLHVFVREGIRHQAPPVTPPEPRARN